MKLVISQKMIHEQRILYKNAKHVPLDLRPKKTHALRLKLKKEQRMKKTLRQKKRSIHFPKRIYAIKQSE